MGPDSTTLPDQVPATVPSGVGQIQPTSTSQASANPSTVANEQQLDNAGAGQQLDQTTAGSSAPNNEQPLDDNVELDWDKLFSDPSSNVDFLHDFFDEKFFLQYNPLLAMEAAGPSMAADETLPNLVTSVQPTRDPSPPALQYPPGGNMPAASTQGRRNYRAFFNQTMQQASHEHHPFEGDDDWNEFIDTAKRANNWGPDDPHLGGL